MRSKEIEQYRTWQKSLQRTCHRLLVNWKGLNNSFQEDLCQGCKVNSRVEGGELDGNYNPAWLLKVFNRISMSPFAAEPVFERDLEKCLIPRCERQKEPVPTQSAWGGGGSPIKASDLKKGSCNYHDPIANVACENEAKNKKKRKNRKRKNLNL